MCHHGVYEHYGDSADSTYVHSYPGILPGYDCTDTSGNIYEQHQRYMVAINGEQYGFGNLHIYSDCRAVCHYSFAERYGKPTNNAYVYRYPVVLSGYNSSYASGNFE